MLSQSRKAAILQKLAQLAPTAPPTGGASLGIDPIALPDAKRAAGVRTNLGGAPGLGAPGVPAPKTPAAPMQYGKRPAVTTIDMTGT